MQKFCHHCGKKLATGAKFCSDCGTDLSKLSAAPPKANANRATFAPVQANPTPEDDDYIDHIEHLDIRQNGLQIEIDSPTPPKETIGGAMLIGQQMGPPTPDNQLPPRGSPYEGKEINKEAFEKEFQQEAGSMRPSDKPHSIKAA